MTKESPPSMSSSKSSSLPETTTASPSLYTISDAHKDEIHLMDELPDLLVMVFPESKIAGSITLGCMKLAYVNGLKKNFLDKFMGSVKNANHFTVYNFSWQHKT